VAAVGLAEIVRIPRGWNHNFFGKLDSPKFFDFSPITRIRSAPFKHRNHPYNPLNFLCANLAGSEPDFMQRETVGSCKMAALEFL
jgi:hypothetical protein